MFKKAVQQGPQGFWRAERTRQYVSNNKIPRTPLAAFFNTPFHHTGAMVPAQVSGMKKAWV